MLPWQHNNVALNGIATSIGKDGLTAVNPIAQNWLELFPKPPAMSTCAVCVYTGTQNRTQFSKHFRRPDRSGLQPCHLLYARYSYNNVATSTPGSSPQPWWPARRSAQRKHRHLRRASYRSGVQLPVELHPRFFAELAAESRNELPRVDNQSYPLNHGSNATAAFGFPGVNTGGTDVSGLTPISFPGYGALGDGIALPLDYDPRQLPASRSLIDSNGTRARDQRP
jgi:hypothetical protein